MSGGGGAAAIVTCSCGHELVEHEHHHLARPQPCRAAGCGCADFDGFERPAVTRLELAAEQGGMGARLSEVMNRFPEVEWDRWAVEGGFGSIFGWVDREAERELWVEASRTRIAALDLAAGLERIGGSPDMLAAVKCVRDLCEALESLPLRRDFLVLDVVEGHVHGFTTSSSTLSDEFNRRLGFPDEGHVECRRVEDTLPDVERAVRL